MPSDAGRIPDPTRPRGQTPRLATTALLDDSRRNPRPPTRRRRRTARSARAGATATALAGEAARSERADAEARGATRRCWTIRAHTTRATRMALVGATARSCTWATAASHASWSGPRSTTAPRLRAERGIWRERNEWRDGHGEDRRCRCEREKQPRRRTCGSWETASRRAARSGPRSLSMRAGRDSRADRRFRRYARPRDGGDERRESCV